MSIEERLANSIDNRIDELIEVLQDRVIERHSTDPVTYSLGIHFIIKRVSVDIKNLIADAGIDGRFKKGWRHKK